MKRRNVTLSFALALVLLFALAVPAAAASGTSSIEITYRAIKIAVNGAEITPTDAAGAPAEPFIYNGTTYLPIRAVAGALGLSAVWDGANSTVFLTSGEAAYAGGGTPAATNATRKIDITYRNIKIAINGVRITPTDAAGAPVEPFIYNGTTYLPVRAVAKALGVEVGWDGETGTVYLGEQPSKTVWLPLTETNYNADGAVICADSYIYDNNGRCTSVNRHYPDHPDRDYTVTITYDPAGHLIMEDYGAGYSQYAYDANGYLISDKYYYGSTMVEWQYTYDAAGRLARTDILDEGGALVGSAVYSYDARGDLVRVISKYGDGESGYSVLENYVYKYGASGQLLDREYAYLGDGYAYGTYYIYKYNADGRLSVAYQYWVEDGEKSYSDTLRYAYDGDGNLANCTSDSGMTVYTYISVAH